MMPIEPSPLNLSFQPKPLSATDLTPLSFAIEPIKQDSSLPNSEAENQSSPSPKFLSLQSLKNQFDQILTIGSFSEEGSQKLKNTYLILIFLLLACLGIGLSIQAQTSWIKDFSLDVASEIVGILLVIFSVDRVIDAERKKRKKKKELVALHQIKNALVRQTHILLDITQYPLGTSPESSPFFLEITPIKFLSEMINQLSTGSTDSKVLNRLSQNTTEIIRFRDFLNSILEKYSYFLSPERIHLIEKAVNAPLILSLEQDHDSVLNDNPQSNLDVNAETLHLLLTDYSTRLSELVKICNSEPIKP